MTAAACPDTPPAAPDRAAHRRLEPDLVDALRADPGTRVLQVCGDAVPVDAAGALRWATPAASADATAWAFLGVDRAGTALLAAAASPPAPAGWRSLRECAAALTPEDLDRALTAVSLGRWLRDAPFCAACGAETLVAQAGWSRHCPSCGRTHFPRTDPAVIVAITDAAGDRILLGSNAAWPAGRYSCFAGFAEAGESLEDAVRREVFEEAGVVVRDPVYQGSQPWPYPRSLMLGFRAVTDAETARADGEEIAEVRWFTRAEIAAAQAGEGDVTLPGSASIAFRMIRDWLAETP
ncbi:MAG: NAD(+) diphosphatase [Microbacterium sp.]|uniref:NAD(+) diphosphatase n=1 Tax=Microbacterium sp. TaxID=51671 RepID=UPI0039E6D5C2